jgi:tight adherence protein B
LGMSLQLPLWVIALLMVIVLGGVFYYLKLQCVNRVKIIEKQLPDALDLMVRAQQSGHSFISALQITASESLAPIGLELQKVFDEINLGIGVQTAMTHLASRIDSKEIRYFVVAVLIQNETGGNLAEVLRKTAALIRERQKIVGVVRVLSAEGRISAWILSLLPFVLAFLLYFINPDFISVLWKNPIGLNMLGLSLCLMLAGVFWMSRLVQIRV